MKVMQVNVDGWFYGRPKYVCKLAKLLLNSGVDCKIIGGSGLFEEELKNNSIKNIRIFPKWKPLDRSVRSIINLYKIIKNEKPDLIHSHGITENIIMGIIGGMLKIPVLATYHTNPFDKYQFERSIEQKIKRYSYELFYIDFLTKIASRNFTYITVISDELKKSFVQQGFKQSKIKVVYFGVDVGGNDIQFKLKRRGEKSILFVGRVSTEKGCGCLLRACKRIADRGKTFKLALIGHGRISYFSDMAIKLGIDGRVLFAGFRREFNDFLMGSDIFILPSRGEGLPISILEAMAYGLPIIGTNVGGISEVIEDGENGYLVPPNDEISLADAIDRMIGIKSKERYIMGLKNKEKIKKIYSTKKMVQHYLDIYEKSIYNTGSND